jgi:uncharacterized protein (TIGR01777 family)
MTTLITGGTGFVGQKLIAAMEQPIEKVLMSSRNADRTKRIFGETVSDVIQWNPTDKPIDLSRQLEVDAVVNLMGEPIAEGRWNESKKKRIRDSRVLGTRNLVDGLVASQNLPTVFVSASAVGIYGDAGESFVKEDHAHGAGFLTEVCEQWEFEANRLVDLGVRVVNLRIGIVLGKDGGALAQLVPIFRWGGGGRLGSGRQWVPWIHVDDLIQLIIWCLDNPAVSGPLNASAPNPVRNQQLTRELATALNRPALLPLPKFAARIALGEFANSLFFSQRVVPEYALSHGFQFQFPELQNALQDLLKDNVS